MREHSVLANEEEHIENLKLAEEAARIIPSLSIGENGNAESEQQQTVGAEELVSEASAETASIDTEIIASSDSEQEERDRADDYYAVGMNVS